MTLDQLFDAAEDLELRHAKLYAHFALAYGEWDQRIATFWEQMSTEEWQHYIILNFCRRLCDSAMDLCQDAPEVNDAALRQTQQLLGIAETSIREAKLTLQEAFESAITLERCESDAIYDTLIDVTQRAVRLLDRPYLMQRIRKAQTQADQHADRLIQAVRRFADSPALVREAQRTLKD